MVLDDHCSVGISRNDLGALVLKQAKQAKLPWISGLFPIEKRHFLVRGDPGLPPPTSSTSTFFTWGKSADHPMDADYFDHHLFALVAEE